MSVDMFLNVKDIKGEAAADGHVGEIQITDWQWGVAQPGSAHTGAGVSTSKVKVEDITFTKLIDKASPNLLRFCCKGKTIPEMTFVSRKAGDKPLDYLKITLKNAMVSQINFCGVTVDEQAKETVTFNFEEIHFEYTPQKEDGAGDASFSMNWNIKRNAEK